MNTLHRKILLVFLKIGDLVLATLAYGFASFLLVHLGTGTSFSEFWSIRIKLVNFLVFGVALLAWHLIYLLCHLYESKRLCTARELMLEELKATGLAAACLLVIAAFVHIRMITLPFLILFWALNSSALIASRAALRYVLGGIRSRGRNLRYTLILGTNSRALEFSRCLRAKPEWGYRNLGFADIPWSGLRAFYRLGNTLACDLAELSEFLRNNVVDEVAIYLPLRSLHAEASSAAALCAQHGITVRYDPDVFG